MGHSLALLQVLLCFLVCLLHTPTARLDCNYGPKVTLFSHQLLCREFCTTQKQLLHHASPVQATCAVFDVCASQAPAAYQPGTRVFSSTPPLYIFLLHMKVPTHLEAALVFSCLSLGSLIFRASARKTKISREEEGFPPPLRAV